MSQMKKITLAGMFIALSVALSQFSIPVGAARCFPVQHMANVLAGVLLGPVYACAAAFATSLLRVLMGTGSLLAFPGSMIGALLAGLLFQRTHRLSLACIGELVGTGVLGALAAYPVAVFAMGKDAAVLAYVIPFMISSAGGVAVSAFILGVLRRTPVLRLVYTKNKPDKESGGR